VARLINKSIFGGDATAGSLNISGVAVAPLFDRVLRQQKMRDTKDVYELQGQGPRERLDDIEQIDDADGQKISEETSLDNLEQAKDFLKRSNAFLGLYERLHAWIFPITKDYIRHSILANTTLEKDYLKLHCQVDWELANYCQQELSGNTELNRVLTITGSLTCAQAASCEDYVKQTWGPWGEKALNAIVDGFVRDRSGKSFLLLRDSH
jgi:hypothetical protein